MAELPTGTVTFLFTDIEGSTTRWEHQREAMQRALARHDAILRTAIEAHGGHVFKTVGDAFYASDCSVRWRKQSSSDQLRGAIPGFKPTASGCGRAQHGVGTLLDGQT